MLSYRKQSKQEMGELMIVIKMCIYALSTMLIGIMGWTMVLGRKWHNARKTGGEDVFNGALHQYCAGICFRIAILIGIAVEGALTIKYGLHRPHLPGFMGHLWCGVAPFLILFPVCYFWITGENEKLGRYHRVVTYPCFAAAISMAVTGDLLLHSL